MSRIIRLQANNVKRLKAVDITPSANGTTLIGGRNAQGKSSVLDAIMYAFAGGKHIPGKPIRNGEKSAEVIAETEDFIVRRRFTEKGSRLEVTTADGASHKSPQTILDQYVGAISFDPMAFMRAAPKDQARILRDAMGVDTTDVEQRRAAAYDRRRDAGRDLRAAEARLDAAPSHPDAPAAPVSLDDLRREYADAQQRNREIEAAAKATIDAANDVRHWSDEIDRLEEMLAEAKQRHESAEIRHIKATDAEIEAGDPIDLDAITARSSELEAINAKVRANAEHAKLSEQVRSLAGEVQAFTETIEQCDAERAAMLADAGMPIDGLDVSDEGVTFNGVPVDQASMSEQIRISCAIAFAGNPKLRVAFVRDGSLLDDSALAELAALAEQHDFQVWVERVGGDDPGAIVIEDGEVAVGVAS